MIIVSVNIIIINIVIITPVTVNFGQVCVASVVFCVRVWFLCFSSVVQILCDPGS